MICPKCRAGEHDGCPGKGQCNCQHRPPRRLEDPGCGAVDAEAGRDPCRITPSRLYPCGYRCEGHKP